ncbi:MAG: hypothetical protein KF850_02900 [Labilithrix sp.]|nr:hypothetical protein [Labilithrix sp.]
MRRLSTLGVAAVISLAACKGEVVPLGGPVNVDTTSETSASGIVVPTGTLAHSGKVDLLLMIDNSASMGDKQELLRRSIPDLVRRLVTPNCVDDAGRVLGRSEAGACATGSLEYAPVTDLHVGVLTSSLGGRGGDVCPESNPQNDDRAHLVTRTASGGTVANAASGFLAFGPGGIVDPQVLEDDIAALVSGVGTSGCGLEAQLESWYRFLVEPDPYRTIVGPGASPELALVGTDGTVLKQRHDFLRPDSLLSLIVLTDEDDSGADPLAAHGNGWAFTNKNFPGSTTFRGGAEQGTTAARGTSACATQPLSDACTSCGFKEMCDLGTAPQGVPCDVVTSDPICVAGAYYGPADDELNVRFFQMRRRFGVDPQFPLKRYVHGLLSAKVPDRFTDHDAEGRYVAAHTCDNPIYAAALPELPTDELCHLPSGPRSQRLVVVTVIAGAPPELVHPNMMPADWTALLGQDPEAYDFAGIDPHMVQSIEPRPDLPPPSAADDADPVHGREWNTNKSDLQYACTFALETPRTCQAGQPECSCFPERLDDSPLCDPASPDVQLRAKAYPGIRPLQLARLLGDNAVAASICPPIPDAPSPAPPVAYRAAMNQLGDRMARSLLPASK